MAEGFLRYLGGDKFEVFSAGTKPTQVNPLAIKVMAEMGVDISSHRSKYVKKFIGQKFDYVVTVCDNAKQICPIFPGNSQKIHWDVDDPAEIEGAEEKKLIIFRKVRDQIKEYILQFLKKT